MKHNRLGIFCLVSGAAASAFASGFGLYEPSAVSHAMGGALVGKAMDASANYNNPATLTDLTNLQFTVGFVTEHPRGSVEVWKNGRSLGEYTMDSGLFWLPHFQMAAPLPWGFTFGLGLSAEYGLGTDFGDSWPMNWSSTKTTVQGFVINPNIAYKITDKWSIAGGLRWLYFDFEQDLCPLAPYQVAPGYLINAGSFNYHLKGDNGFGSTGWMIGTKYDILDNLSVGAVYKSQIDVGMDGDTDMSVRTAMKGGERMLAQQAAARCGSADANMRLPQSVSAGVNWDITQTWHAGAAISWTEWSQFDALTFNVVPTPTRIGLDWRDTWRSSVGVAWDFLEDWTWMVSYVYDMDCTSVDQTSTMLPPADRHIASTGFTWRCWRGLELTLSYSCVFMDGGEMRAQDAFGNVWDMETCWGYCHAAGFSMTYRF